MVLVGLMGAGKSTIGRQLAKRFSWDFLDLDREIENRTGVKVSVIFELEGEQGFRDRETRLLEELANGPQRVLATGGGVVIRPENRTLLRQMGSVIYLDVAPEVLFERTRRDANRPLLQVPDPLGKLKELHAQRDPLYRDAADIVISPRPGSVGSVVKQIEQALSQCTN